MGKMTTWVKDRLNEGKIVQVAITATNTCYWAYLTTSGMVCRKEYSYVEDCMDHDETYALPFMPMSRIDKLQGILERLYYNG